MAAAIGAYEDAEQVEIARLLETAHGGRPQVQHAVGRPVDLKLRGVTYQVTAFRIGPQRYRVTVAQGDESATVEASQMWDWDRSITTFSGSPL